MSRLLSIVIFLDLILDVIFSVHDNGEQVSFESHFLKLWISYSSLEWIFPFDNVLSGIAITAYLN